MAGKLMVLLIAMLMLFPFTVSSQTPSEWALLGADAGIRSLDAYSTRSSLERGAHEDYLPGAIANHTAPMIAFSSGIVAFNWFLMREFDRHGHHKLAKLVPLVDIGIDGPDAIHNLYVQRGE
jgi:hypothetical protein